MPDDRSEFEGAKLQIELRVDSSLVPSVLRAFAGTTPLDAEVDVLELPRGPRWLRLCVGFLRWYRSKRPGVIERRCVFDPSCSRYSELAFRRRGFFRGALATLDRLRRCRPGSGGVDVP
jgi:putative component of membrane protein insertase Oxa1/YidC/SpoIIIJ protein YidD